MSNNLNSLNTRLERQVDLWCIHNKDVLNHPDHGKKWIVVFYEDLVENPDKELLRLASQLDLKVSRDAIDFQKPSRSDYHNEFIIEKTSQLKKWQDNLSENELKALQDVFDHYGITVYSAFSIYPVNSESKV